jgi:hypothetical protein
VLTNEYYYCRFEEGYLQGQGSPLFLERLTVKVDAIHPSETSVYIYQLAQRNIPPPKKKKTFFSSKFNLKWSYRMELTHKAPPFWTKLRVVGGGAFLILPAICVRY